MKKIKYILSFAILTLFLFGCDVQQASQDVSPIISTDSYSTATFTLSGGSLISNEGDETVYVYEVELDKPLQFDHDFAFVELDGTTATLHEDYDFIDATIPSFETSAQLKVIIYNDTEIEDTETINLAVVSGPAVADANRLNPNTQYPELNLSIENFESDDFKVQLDWDATYLDSDGDAHSLCDLDLDIEIYLADFSDIVATSYSSCPEAITIPSGALADGDYWLVPSFWSTAGFVPPASNVQIPAMFTFSTPGLIEKTVDLTSAWDTDTGGNEQGNSDAYLVKYILTISGTSYTVTDNDSGTVVFQN